VVSTADPIWRFHSLPVTRRRSCAIREEEALNVEVSRCGVNDQGWKEGKSTVCAECELLVSLWILDLGLCPSRQKQVRMQGHCKPLGVEPGYLQTRRAKTARKAFVCQDHPSGRTPFLSRLGRTCQPIGRETFSPRPSGQYPWPPVSKREALSGCHERGGRRVG